MNSLDSPRDYSTEDLLIELKSKTATVSRDVTALLQRGGVEDATDRQLVENAVAFIENPTEEYSDIKTQTTFIGDVLCGYEMNAVEIPKEIDELHRYLLTLSCINRIHFVEQELDRKPLNSPAIEKAMVWALDPATHLSRGYKDNTLLTAVNELQDRLKNL